MLRRCWQDLWFSLQCAKDGNKKHKTKDNKSIKKQRHQKGIKNKGIKKKQEMDLLTIWASAHGLAAIACMSGVIPSMDWDEMLERDDLLR